jgi:phospholipid-transporting ATPase
VGISGLEGMQAAMASDFTIAQFRFLAPLLLVHGRLSYKRITRMICFFFYKNLLYGSTIFVYNAFALFSGQPIYNDFYMTLFNVVFTAAAPLVIGWFDRDLDKNAGLRFPFLYKEGELLHRRACVSAQPVRCGVLQHRLRVQAMTRHDHRPTTRASITTPAGQQNLYFSLPAIVGWLGTALLHAAVIVITVLLGADSLDSDSRHGHAWSLLRNGLLMFTIVIITVHLQLALVIDQWMWMHHAALWGSIGERRRCVPARGGGAAAHAHRAGPCGGLQPTLLPAPCPAVSVPLLLRCIARVQRCGLSSCSRLARSPSDCRRTCTSRWAPSRASPCSGS